MLAPLFLLVLVLEPELVLLIQLLLQLEPELPQSSRDQIWQEGAERVRDM